MCTLGPMVREVKAKRQVGQVGVWEALRQHVPQHGPAWSEPQVWAGPLARVRELSPICKR